MNSEQIEICGRDFRYVAHVGRGLLGRVGLFTREVVRGHRAAIITDSNVPLALVNVTVASVAAEDFDAAVVTVPAGENAKTFPEVERICEDLSALDRNSVIVGLGGGVVGDLSGFIAAILRRGIAHVQIPTTLLAMVDSSIGGKTGVNLAAGKNLVGAIHHPALVVADVDVLRTLPARQLRQGYAEIVKHAIICDAELFRALNASPEISPDPNLIARNIRIKAAVVTADAREESGERALLNFGHTVGHGIERASEFRLPHGECVSLGIVAACAISVKRAGFSPGQFQEVVALLRHLQLPTKLPAEISREQIMAAVARDKKFESGHVRFVLTPRIGKAHLSRDVTMADIEQAVAAL